MRNGNQLYGDGNSNSMEQKTVNNMNAIRSRCLFVIAGAARYLIWLDLSIFKPCPGFPGKMGRQPGPTVCFILKDVLLRFIFNDNHHRFRDNLAFSFALSSGYSTPHQKPHIRGKPVITKPAINPVQPESGLYLSTTRPMGTAIIRLVETVLRV